MLQEIILQRRLQERMFCDKGVCSGVHGKWTGLADAVAAHGHDPQVVETAKLITNQHHNLFGYPNEERGLWLRLEGNGFTQYAQKERAAVVYFVSCKQSFLIPSQQTALDIVKELSRDGVDFAVLGDREWCCGRVLKGLGLDEEFEVCKQHNSGEIQRLKAKQVIFTCHSCYDVWHNDYHIDGVELIYRKSIN